jgi:hypothetical protein
MRGLCSYRHSPPKVGEEFPDAFGLRLYGARARQEMCGGVGRRERVQARHLHGRLPKDPRDRYPFSLTAFGALQDAGELQAAEGLKDRGAGPFVAEPSHRALELFDGGAAKPSRAVIEGLPEGFEDIEGAAAKHAVVATLWAGGLIEDAGPALDPIELAVCQPDRIGGVIGDKFAALPEPLPKNAPPAAAMRVSHGSFSQA